MPSKPVSFSCVLGAWHSHESELRSFLTHRLSDAHIAEDLLQEVFLKAMRQGSNFCSLDSTRAWLFEVARNAITDHFRLRRDQVELPDDLVADAEHMETIDSLATCIPRVLSELSESNREAISLCDLQGMTQDEFARTKGITLPGAKSRVQRARRRLLDQLTKACQVQFDDAGKVTCFVPRPPAN
jgi:RNA polymerase sigma-70 factor, ECF subfamily